MSFAADYEFRVEREALVAERHTPQLESLLRFDAIVVATAAVSAADVLTDDLDDVEILAEYAGVRVLATSPSDWAPRAGGG